jgi:hypothetical protein
MSGWRVLLLATLCAGDLACGCASGPPPPRPPLDTGAAPAPSADQPPPPPSLCDRTSRAACRRVELTGK